MVELPDEWAVDYEQSGLQDLWIYEFDHDPAHDGAWRRLNAESDGWYRIIDARIQFLAPHGDGRPTDWDAMMARFRELPPLGTEDSVEIVIRAGAGAMRMSHRDSTTDVPVTSLSHADLNAAYEMLRGHPDQWACVCKQG